MKQKNKIKVFVGLSGGVDSSVCAYLLKQQGCEVVGAFIKIWQPEFLDTCTWKEDRRSAMQVASRLKIPFVTIDLSQEYKDSVVDYMISEYREGRTPNPDVMCNKEIKFKAFLNKVLLMGADMIATGHYAKVNQKSKIKNQNFNSKGDKFELLKATDASKEQSYFLWTLGQRELSKVLFPIGGLPKSEVRKIAEKAGLHTFERKDSQGLCFIGKVDFKVFLKGFIPPKRGDVLNEAGEIIGYHEGAMFLTIGERRGFIITKKTTHDSPMYVISKDITKNTITVAPKQVQGISTDTTTHYTLSQCNWISGAPCLGQVYDAQVRYHQDYQKCTIENITGNEARVVFERPQTGAVGQSVVFYSGDVCIGGGVIK